MTATSPLYASCRRCGAHILEVRWDWQLDTVIGTPRLDPVALDYQQITACVVAGIPLWQLQRQRLGNWVTSRRSFWWPRTPVDGHTLPAHACGARWDAFPVDLSTAPVTYPDTPPF